MTSSTESPQTPATGDASPRHHNHRVISTIFEHIPHPHIHHRKKNPPKPIGDQAQADRKSVV